MSGLCPSSLTITSYNPADSQDCDRTELLTWLGKIFRLEAAVEKLPPSNLSRKDLQAISINDQTNPTSLDRISDALNYELGWCKKALNDPELYEIKYNGEVINAREIGAKLASALVANKRLIEKANPLLKQITDENYTIIEEATRIWFNVPKPA